MLGITQCYILFTIMILEAAKSLTFQSYDKMSLVTLVYNLGEQFFF